MIMPNLRTVGMSGNNPVFSAADSPKETVN